MSDPFDLEAVLGEPVAAGTNLLLSGPPMGGKDGVFLDLLAASFAETDAAVVISTNEDTAELVQALDDRTDASRRLRGVDCTRNDPVGDERVTGVSTPADLTGIGMHIDRHLGDFTDHALRTRLGLTSISTLLVYADFQPIFRFIHVLTGRVATTESLGLFVVDDTSHDEQVMSAIVSLFDGRVHVEDDEVRVTGL